MSRQDLLNREFSSNYNRENKCKITRCINKRHSEYSFLSLGHQKQDNCGELCIFGRLCINVNNGRGYGHVKLDSCKERCLFYHCINTNTPHIRIDSCKDVCKAKVKIIYTDMPLDLKVYDNKCLICQDDADLVFQCGHTGCRSCINIYRDNGNENCFLCKQPIQNIYNYLKPNSNDQIFDAEIYFDRVRVI